jgi:hypothetical protein
MASRAGIFCAIVLLISFECHDNKVYFHVADCADALLLLTRQKWQRQSLALLSRTRTRSSRHYNVYLGSIGNDHGYLLTRRGVDLPLF